MSEEDTGADFHLVLGMAACPSDPTDAEWEAENNIWLGRWKPLNIFGLVGKEPGHQRTVNMLRGCAPKRR
ncbi:hypothetical protein [Deinococcus sp. Marseille-Q6407]|uniref:hypothetical protein n=1 Tax=Deinococcus sp. Marseille-Q6407 TaxID=2969223 RepID=UPI0021BF4345|nr:hypothetical protein [Deinococcus sp. Marseille-Q6407]